MAWVLAARRFSPGPVLHLPLSSHAIGPRERLLDKRLFHVSPWLVACSTAPLPSHASLRLSVPHVGGRRGARADPTLTLPATSRRPSGWPSDMLLGPRLLIGRFRLIFSLRVPFLAPLFPLLLPLFLEIAPPASFLPFARRYLGWGPRISRKPFLRFVS
jgi:hypothetical protein